MQQTQSWGPPWRHDRRSGRFRAREFGGGGGPGPATAIIAALFQVIGANNLAQADGVFRPMTFWVYALLLAGPLAMLVRGPFPVAVFAIAATASIGFATFATPSWVYMVAAAMALFRLPKKGRRTAGIVGAAVAYVAYILVCRVFADPLGIAEAARPSLRDLVLLALGLIVLIFLGGAAKVRGEHMAEVMKARAERQRAQQEQERRQASEERLRIARELHDVLGHHLSLINVQAGVGLHLMDSRPEQAREALAAIKTASAEALREVRSVLGVLRTENEAAPRQPALGLSRLDDLTADAGVPVETKVTGEPRPLPAEVDRAAYRIVQEALTNVRRHAGTGASASVAIDYLPTALHLAIRSTGVATLPGDDGPPAGGERPASIAERVAGGRKVGGAERLGGGRNVQGAERLGGGRNVGGAERVAGGRRVGGAERTAADEKAAADQTAAGRDEHDGSGISGMRARAESLGGAFEAGPVDGGFLVSVVLPAVDTTEGDG